jgi:hypothetical protein
MMVSWPSFFAAATRSLIESAEAAPAKARSPKDPIAKTEDADSAHLLNPFRLIWLSPLMGLGPAC